MENVGEAFFLEDIPSKHAVVVKHRSTEDKFTVFVPDAIYSSSRIEELTMAMRGITYALRSVFRRRIFKENETIQGRIYLASNAQPVPVVPI